MKTSICFNNISLFVIGFFTILVLNTSCNSAKKSLYNGDYDDAISRSTKKLRKNRKNEKQALLLEKAYNKANARDTKTLKRYKSANSAINWERVYTLYQNLHRRQEKVRPFVPLRIASLQRNAVLPIEVDYSTEMMAAKTKATESLYASANKLMQSNSKEQARQAYNKLQKVKDLNPNYRDVNNNLEAARYKGTNFILLNFKNNTGMALPPDFQQEITRINTNNLDQNWAQYHLQARPNLQYDYDAVINLERIDISPEAVQQNRLTETKEIEDGFQYQFDNRGNVLKDSLGNDIKTKKYRNIVCEVVEIKQQKNAQITGSIDYFNRKNRQLISRHSISASSNFEHEYGLASGDQDALSNRYRKLCRKTPASFPSNYDMILKASNSLRSSVNGILCNRKNIPNR